MLDLNNNGVVSQTEVLRPLHLVQHCHQFGAKSIIERYVQRAVPKLKFSADHRLSKSLLYQQAEGCELKDFALVWPAGNIPRLPLNGNQFPVQVQDVIGFPDQPKIVRDEDFAAAIRIAIDDFAGDVGGGS
jgi:hypothetical protein